MLFEDFIFDECYTDYDRMSDPNKDANGEGTHQRVTKAIGSEMDDNTIPLIANLQSNVFTSPLLLSKFVGHKESEAGYSKRWRSWFMAQTPAWRKNVVRIMERLYRIRTTKQAHTIMFGWLGFGVTITEIFNTEGLDTIHTFDVPLHTLDSSCPRCTTYEVYITGAGGSLTADEITAITAILKFNQPVDAQIADILYNGTSVIDDFDLTDPELGFSVYTPEDADALAFITAAGISGTTTKRAIEILVLDLKSAGLWGELLAVYPMVGGTSDTCKYNLKDPRDLDAAYRLTFVNAPTIDGHGVLWNGVNQYADTHLVPGSALSTRNICMVYYNLVNASAGIDMGVYHLVTNRYDLDTGTGTGHMQVAASGPSTVAQVSKGVLDSTGLYLVTSDDTTIYPYRNGVALSTVARAVNTTPNTDTFYLGAENRVTLSGGPFAYNNSKCGFAMIGEPLTPIEAATLSTIINDFMTRLSKNTY